MKLNLLAATILLVSTGHSYADVKVGLGAPLTGPNAVFGEQMRRGVQAAIDDVNSTGGVLKEKLVLVLGDDRSDPKEGVSVANKFTSDGVHFVIGHFNSGVSIPASDVYAENGILQITPTSTNPVFTDRGLWNTHRTVGRDDQQAEIAGAWLLSNKKDSKLAIVHDKTPYGQGVADFTRIYINEGGISEVLYQGINPGEKDYSALVSKLKELNVDFVYYGGLHTEAGLIVRQMRDQGLDATFMVPDAVATKEFWAVAGPGAEGTLMTFNPDPRKNPAAAGVVERFRAQGYDPESYTIYSYAALEAIASAMKSANTLDPNEVAKELRSGKPISTVLGTISWDNKGDLSKADYIIYTWTNGDYVAK